MRFKIWIATAMLLMTGCITGPDTEKKHPLNYLNGENYAGTEHPTTLILPVGQNKERVTVVQGVVMNSGQGIEARSIQNVTVHLLSSNQKQISQSTSDANGKFYFSGIFPNGKYTLKIVSKSYQGVLPIYIQDYKLDGLILIAEKTTDIAH